MSDILIRGMELPEDKEICLRIDKKGEVYVYGSYPTELYKAVPVPDHGRLVDEEQLIKNIEDAIENIDSDFQLLDFNSRYCMERGLRMAKIFVKAATTIIPASMEGET